MLVWCIGTQPVSRLCEAPVIRGFVLIVLQDPSASVLYTEAVKEVSLCFLLCLLEC